MPGRGDNNKNGSSGRGASNQSNQGFPDAGKKSNHARKTSGGQPSKPEPKDGSTDANRNRAKPE